jgi:hypothetical protein
VGGVSFVHTTTVRLPSRTKRLFSIAGFGFKQIKQTLKLADFLGHSANAVRWQIWSALLCYLLLGYQAFLTSWGHSFTRLFTLLRSTLWQKIDLLDLLRSCGTAGGSYRALARPEQAYFPNFA